MTAWRSNETGRRLRLDIGRCQRRLVEVSTSNNRSPARDTALSGRTLLCLLALIPVFFSLVWSPSPAAAATVYSTGFEASEGYNTNLNLVGQNGWRALGSGGNGLLTDVFSGQGQQGYVGYAPPFSGDSYLLVYQPINKALSQVQFSVMMSIFDSTNGNWDDFEWGVYNQEGDFLFSLDFDNFDFGIYYYLDDGNQRVATGQAFENGVPYLLQLNINFASNRWSATLDGALLATNRPITTAGSPLNLGDIDATWLVFEPTAPGNNYMVFDNYLITATVAQPQVNQLGFLGMSPVLRLSGTPNMAFAIEASTNLAQWVSLKTNVTTGGYFDYVDQGAASLPSRFYRGRWVP